ncbi:hypothetical protein LIER_35397 [Lithospermum erythrorhizon]|uniref:Gag-pol polyprotein n=1 Tax=Lithospermum erythrorhizon TaxID=34254 RepID=A0AAV3NR84_LITER
MECMRQGRSIYMPPMLDRTNYDDWRTRMIVFLRSIDIEIWQVVLTGWTVPTIIAIDGTQIIKEEDNWTRKEHELALHNSKALKVILGRMGQKMFKLINMCTTAKEAWKILKTTHEETIEIGKVVVEISETLIEESVTLCVGNTMKTIVVAPSIGDTVADAAEVPSSENLVESVVRSIEDTTEEAPR